MHELIPSPSVLLDEHLLLELVAAQPRQKLRPHEPVHTASEDDAGADEAVEVVRQALVHALSVLGRDVRRDDEVDVGEEEEERDG